MSHMSLSHRVSRSVCVGDFKGHLCSNAVRPELPKHLVFLFPYLHIYLPISVQTLSAASNRKCNSSYFKEKRGLYWLGNQGVQLDPEALTMLLGPSVSPFLSPATPSAGSVTQACLLREDTQLPAVLEVDFQAPNPEEKEGHWLTLALNDFFFP